MSEPPLLEVRIRRKVHPGLMLDLAFSLGRGCGILFGPSGVGKTSALRLIAGLMKPDSGQVLLDGVALFDSVRGVNLPLRERRIGMVFQDDLLFPHLGVAANIGFGLNTWAKAEAKRRVEEVAALCGVEPLLGRRPATLSGGERQRVGLARALAPRPRLLICDEPVSALDLAGRHALIDRLKALQASENLPVLYVTHSPAEAVSLGRWLFLVEGGSVVAEGPPLDVLASASRGGSGRLEGVRNEFRARVESDSAHDGETRLRLEGGPVVVVPKQTFAAGETVVLSVLAEEILLARGPVAGLSARNLIEGAVERILPHGKEAEVLVRTGDLVWVVSVVSPALQALGLESGADVRMIVKARSCHVRVGSDGNENATEA